MDHSGGGDNGPTGLLLVGHGTRDPRGVEEFLATVALVAERARQWSVEPCFLELAEPAIEGGFRALARRGVQRTVVAPVMLFSAGHVQQDIPRAVARAAAEHGGMRIAQAGHFGCQQELLQLAHLRCRQALEGRAAVPEDETVLVMVGRGSRDALATADMLQFAARHHASAGVAETRACFVAMAEPRLEPTLDALARAGYRRIVVQPHLLFHGLLLDRIAQQVARHADCYRRVEWIIAPHLGAHALVAEAIMRRATEVVWPAPD